MDLTHCCLHIIITACGITLLRVYFQMRGYTFPRVFPHVEIHVKWCKSSFGIYTLPLAFPHVKIHLFYCFTASEKKINKNSTCGDTHFLVYFPMWRYTFLCVFSHVEMHIVLCNSSYGFNTLLLTYYHTCMNIISPCLFLLLKKYFHMQRYTQRRVSPHVEMHIILCNLSLSLVFPHVEIFVL